jgi:hypothetical protein
MSLVPTSLAVLVVGILVGYFGAYYRSKKDIFLINAQIDAHFNLAKDQYEMQLEAVRAGQNRVKLDESYERLAMWLNQLERTIDELWFGCCGHDEVAERRAWQITDQWPWETLRVPQDVCSAQLYWSSAVRERLRDFNGKSGDLVMSVRVAITLKREAQDAVDHVDKQTEVWKARSLLLSVLDQVRDQVRIDLGITDRH